MKNFCLRRKVGKEKKVISGAQKGNGGPTFVGEILHSPFFLQKWNYLDFRFEKGKNLT